MRGGVFLYEKDLVLFLEGLTDYREGKVRSCKPNKLQIQAPWVPTLSSGYCSSSVCLGCSKENFLQVGGKALPRSWRRVPTDDNNRN